MLLIKPLPNMLLITPRNSSSNKVLIFRIYLSDFQDFKTHPKEKIEANFTKNSFELKIHDFNKGNYKLSISNLFAEIIPNESSIFQNNSGVVIKLKKSKNETWPSVTKKGSNFVLLFLK